MALTGSLDLTAIPPTITVTSNRRHEKVTLEAAGDQLVLEGHWPITATDDDDTRTWVAVDDDGVTTVFHLV